MNSYENLVARVRQVRRRWRFQVLVRGISLFLASTIALLVLGVWGADLFGFRSYAVWSMRFLTGGTVLFVAWYFLYMPLRGRISDVQVAQFIEEKYPHLEDRLVTAIEYGEQRTSSSGMIDLLIKDAFEKASRVDFSVFLNRKRLTAFGTIGLAAFLLLFALLTWGPSYFPYGFSSLYVPWTGASMASSMMIMVVPGDIEIAKGSDQLIGAQLVGFDSPDVRLYFQSKGSNQWSASGMEPDPRGSSFRYLLVDVQSSQRYYVESKGVRSRTCSISVVDQARVEKIDVTYNFPAYTGMASQVVENEGDISALKGTKLDLRVHLNKPAQSARLFFDNQSTLDLTGSNTQDFSGSFVLQRSGAYVVQATESRGKNHPASSEYEIEALDDAAPRVSITRPMRDVRATNLEEVFSEIKADDDIGIGRLEMHYSVNGAPEKNIRLFSGNPTEPSVTASHTFFLEEFGLQPGDLISYYAKAWDGNNVTGPETSSSDIYFIQIRPFEQNYVQNQQQGGMQGGQEEGQQELSRQQKEIISATFRLIREKEQMVLKEYQDSLKSLALVQSRLQAQTQGLVDRLRRRGAAQADDNFGKLSEYLKNAVGEMGKASVNLGAQKPNDAMPPEQKSLQQLMRAESLFREIQVSLASQNGGGSGSQANAEDLADLFELELNKLKNQYETVQRGEQQERDQKVDEALERLKELAQRQQQLNDRNRVLAQQGGSSSSSGGGNSQGQQQLMEQAEQLKRQLQRLSRERSSPQLNEASNRLQKAIDEMKKALNNSQNGNAAEANAQGLRALQQLDEATRGLAQKQETGLKQGLEQALSESGKLVKEQEQIQERLDRLAKEKSQESIQEDTEQRGEDLISRKSVLADRLDSLENQIRTLSRQARKTQKETSNKLADAAGTISDNRLPERIRSGNALIQNGFYESQKGREDFIRDALEDLNQQLQAAQKSLGQSEEEKIEEAANRARQLSEGLEAIQRQMRELQRGQGERFSRQQEQTGRQGQGQTQRPQQGQQQGQQQAQGQQQGRSQGQGQGQVSNSIGDRSRNSREAPTLRGQNPQNLQGGMPNADTDVRGLSQNAVGPPTGIGGYRNDEERQLSRDFEQRLTDAQNLRPLLDRNSTQMQNLEKVIDALRRAKNYPDYSNAEQIARLRAAIDYMRKIELDLARDLDRLNQIDKYFLAEDNEAPSTYQKLVEEYYKSIAKTKRSGGRTEEN
jgi:hypothetical protein